MPRTSPTAEQLTTLVAADLPAGTWTSGPRTPLGQPASTLPPMWAKRIGAIVRAAALIGGALLVRRALDDDEDSGGARQEFQRTRPPSCASPSWSPACQALAADR